MKQILAYIFAVIVCAAAVSGGSTVLAADTTTQDNPPANDQAILNQSKAPEKSPTSKLTALNESKPARPTAGEFPAMSQPDMSTGVIQVTLGLFVVLLIIAAAAWFTRRFGHFQTTAGGTLRIVGGLHLGARERLVVVQVGDQQLLLGVAPGRISSLHVLDKPLETGATTGRNSPVSGAFLDKLNSVLKRQGQ